MRISEKTSEDIPRDEAEKARKEAERKAKEEITLSGLAEKSYQQVENWIDEATTLAMVKAKMKVLAEVILAQIKVKEVLRWMS